ncbi:hypothetical protein HanXRQr2_Chr02g0049081 [Helianthus annuus]|uniref:Uncharacterized protein n=1 Tax=Helianthus annuus TaxID=4232 RepID=A0A9K3NYC8_HELAN|nr:hypothetical protein HanXRQr2_Chr02g0049081 [Helianthus annuus]KAJ0950459.1 hypothetical protein HanPSC8_Chr02g0048501 [Helianthus annuus]
MPGDLETVHLLVTVVILGYHDRKSHGLETVHHPVMVVNLGPHDHKSPGHQTATYDQVTGVLRSPSESPPPPETVVVFHT